MGTVTGATRMWEVRAAEGRLDDLVAFVLAAAGPEAQVYRSGPPDPRVVVIDDAAAPVPDPPADLVARPPHHWEFHRVR